MANKKSQATTVKGEKERAGAVCETGKGGDWSGELWRGTRQSLSWSHCQSLYMV